MAIHPNTFSGRDTLSPGSRGEIFQADLPGYRNQGDRINRTNNKLATSDHDVPNIKYQFDYRLPVLFRYGFAYGYNQIVIPKGRLVAVDPYMDLVDFDMKKQHNTLTIANGGVPVRLRKATDKYPTFGGGGKDIVADEAQGAEVSGIGKEWVPLVGFQNAYTFRTYRPFVDNTATEEGVKAFYGPTVQLEAEDLYIDPETGKVVDSEGVERRDVRPGNIPIGIMQRNEYTRDDDAYNGMMPGPVLTDKLVELPWFSYKDKAEQNPWGSAYGALFPGALVKSDENGRFVVSPLSFEQEIATMSMAEYEFERQQVVGQVYAVNNNLVPEGAAKWATWALEDRLKFDEFNPMVWSQNNRRGEDAVAHSPYKSTGEYPGYPYDRAYKYSDLHMLASTGRQDVYDQRMNQEHQYDNLGIPGLTDGKNVAVRKYPAYVCGHINKAGEGKEYVEMYFRTSEVDVIDLQISIGDKANFTTLTEGGLLFNNSLKVKYVNELQGIFVLEVVDKEALETEMGEANSVPVYIQFNKRGLSGVPTFMDWDGVVGSVKVLLTK